MSLIQRNEKTGYPIGADDIQKSAYGKIPKCEGRCFQRSDTGTFEVPKSILGWDWSITFNRWSALVEFGDGHQCWSYPSSTYKEKPHQ